MVRIGVPRRPADRLRREPRLRARLQPGGRGGTRRVPAPPQPGHGRPRGGGREPARVRAGPPRARPLRRADARPGRRPSTRARAGARRRSGACSASRRCSPRLSSARGSSTPSRSAAGSATPCARWTSSRAASCSLLARSGRSSAASTPRFFMYGEDADLSLRAAALGYRPAITPDAVVTHEIGVSSADARGQADAALPREGDAPAQALARPAAAARPRPARGGARPPRSLLGPWRGGRAAVALDAGVAEPLATGWPGYPEPEPARLPAPPA